MGVIPFAHCLCVLLAATTSTVAFGSRHHPIADSVTNNAAFHIPSRFSKDKFTFDTDRMAYNYPPNKVIGNASGEIDGSILCTLTECPMGNLVCDALLDSKSSQGAQVCITNADSINGSLRFGSITAKDLDQVLPFPDLAIVLKIPGSTLLTALEKGLEAIGNKSRGGRFPQIAGMNLTVNSRGKVGSRVQSLAIGGKAVVPSKQYILVTNDFLASGGYGLTWKGSKNLTRKPLLINQNSSARSNFEQRDWQGIGFYRRLLEMSVGRMPNGRFVLRRPAQIWSLGCEATGVHYERRECKFFY
jgi:hypothetical protein